MAGRPMRHRLPITPPRHRFVDQPGKVGNASLECVGDLHLAVPRNHLGVVLDDVAPAARRLAWLGSRPSSSCRTASGRGLCREVDPAFEVRHRSLISWSSRRDAVLVASRAGCNISWLGHQPAPLVSTKGVTLSLRSRSSPRSSIRSSMAASNFLRRCCWRSASSASRSA